MRPILRHRIAIAGLLVLAGTAAGCGDSVVVLGPGAPADPGAASAAFDTRAAEVARAWQTSGDVTTWQHGFVPLADLTVLPPGDGTGETKDALTNGRFVLQTPLSMPAPPPGRVTFADGTTMSVPLETAGAAFTEIAPGISTCPTSADPAAAACRVLQVTRVDLGTDTILTSRGPATVPMWQFTVAGLAPPVERVAVSPSVITRTPVSGGNGVSLPGIDGPRALAAISESAVTFRVMVGDCDIEEHPLLYEDAQTVVVGVFSTTKQGICDAVGVIKAFTVTLAKPLGTRVVLDVLTGDPLAVGPYF